MTKLAIVSGGLREPSSTRLLADQLATALHAELAKEEAEVTSTVIELRPLGRAIIDAMLTGYANADLEGAFDTIRSADGLPNRKFIRENRHRRDLSNIGFSIQAARARSRRNAITVQGFRSDRAAERCAGIPSRRR